MSIILPKNNEATTFEGYYYIINRLHE